MNVKWRGDKKQFAVAALTISNGKKISVLPGFWLKEISGVEWEGWLGNNGQRYEIRKGGFSVHYYFKRCNYIKVILPLPPRGKMYGIFDRLQKR